MTTSRSFRHGARERGLARAAYRSFEPYHLVAYFGPHVDAAASELGIGWLGGYTGMRAAPLGPVPGPVVAATFFGFKPAAVTKAWGLALAGHTPAELDAVRLACVDAGLRDALGDLVASPDLAVQVERMGAVINRADLGGRGLAAAYAAQPWPEVPHLALWHAATLWREWRGDGHNAALVARGLTPLEALVLYDAWLPDEPVSATKGRPFLQPSRKWTDKEWMGTAASLADEGLVTVEGGGEGGSVGSGVVKATEAGAALRSDIEDMTDDASAAVWVGVDDAEDLITAFRPYSKAVIKAGILPGTERRT